MPHLSFRPALRQALAPCTLLGFSFFASQAHAADTVLRDVVVSVTHSEYDVRTAPASVSVITREKIEATNPVDLLDAVRGEPGITLTGRSVGGRKTMAMRGLEGKHVLNLIDGRRISASDDAVGHSDYQYGWLPMAAIERIEVVRGPMSTLWGSEALGGVVNLITRQPTDRWMGSLGVSGADSTEGDGGSRAGTNFFVAGPLGERVALSLFGDVQRIGAVPLEEDPRYSELEGRKTQTGGGTIRFQLSPAQTLEAGWTGNQEDRWRGNVATSSTADDKSYRDHYDLERTHGHVSWRGQFEGWRAQANYYRSELDITSQRNNGVTPTRPQNMQNAVLDGLAALKLGMHQLTFGGEHRVETMHNAGLIGGKDDATHKALFVQDELSLMTDWLLTAGLRADHHEIFGTEYSPRVYLVWEATPELIVKGGYGHAFKAPTLKQISPNYVGAEGPHTFLGNANVKPERSDSYEIGVDWQRSGLNLRGVLYHTRIEDLISTTVVEVVGPRTTYLYDNVNRAKVIGAEAGFTWTLREGLDWNTDLTLLKTKNADTGAELTGRPKRSLGSRIDWDVGGGWSMRGGVEYIGRQLTEVTTGNYEHLPHYALWNASVAKRLDKSLTLRAGFENLGNTRLAEKSPNFSYAERGRTLFASLRADF